MLWQSIPITCVRAVFFIPPTGRWQRLLRVEYQHWQAFPFLAVTDSNPPLVTYAPSYAVVPCDRMNWFATQIQPHEPEVRGYLRNHFPSVDVDDVVQESYLKIWRRRATDTIATAKAYFFSTARNTALTLIRRRNIYSNTPVNELPYWSVIDNEPDALDKLNRRQQYELVVGAISQLPRRCRDIVSLSAVEGLSNQEIALRLNLSESTVRVQTARGIRKITDNIRSRSEHG